MLSIVVKLLFSLFMQWCFIIIIIIYCCCCYLKNKHYMEICQRTTLNLVNKHLVEV